MIDNPIWERYTHEGREALKKRQFDEAERCFKKALMDVEQFGQKHPLVPESLNNLAQLHATRYNYVEAERLYSRALSIVEKNYGADSIRGVNTWMGLGWIYFAQNDYAQTESCFKQAMQIRQHNLGREHPEVADSYNALAKVYSASYKHKLAAEMFKQSLEIYTRILTPEDPRLIDARNRYEAAQHNCGVGG